MGVPDDSGRSVGIKGCEEGVHCACGRCCTEDGRIGADFVEHGEKVGSPGLEVRGRASRVEAPFPRRSWMMRRGTPWC